MPPGRETLLQSAKSLCDSFANKQPLDNVLMNFSSQTCPDDDIFCLEHGLTQLAPFLGRKFVGLNGVKEYFTLIANLLAYEDMKFSDYIVDVQTSVVSVRGTAVFEWKSTQNKWEEVFTYRLVFDDDAKVKVYEVWADSGAAYLASEGQLG